MSKNVLIIVLLWLTVFVASAQTPGNVRDTVFRVRCSAFGGAMGTVYAKPPTSQSETSTFLGGVAGARAVWHPNHRLAVGVQSGYMVFSSQELVVSGSGTSRAGLAAIPLHLVVTMTSKQFEVGVGLGMYYLQSLWKTLDGERAASSDMEYGINPWIGYQFAVSDRLSVGPEIGAHILSNRGIDSFTIGVTLTADVLRY